MDKLDQWSEDRRKRLEAELEKLDEKRKETKKAARSASTLAKELELQRALRRLDSQRDKAWRSSDEERCEVERQKDALLDEISKRMAQKTEFESLFAVRFSLV
jgi:hypothetical protein